MSKRVATTFFGECRIFRLDIIQRIDDHETTATPGRARGRPPQLIAARVFGCQCRVRFKGIDPTMEIAALEKSPGAKLLTTHHTL